ncbi:MAG: RNA-directed DNA polymerase [Acidobacteria bacterium]|nr:RNA-directed DNA polymerase [Acidobacteriota bacterium]
MSHEPLPVALAIRQTLSGVTFSNPLPFWTEPSAIDFDRRERAIEARIDALLSGEMLAPVFDVAVPRRSGGATKWLVPSINDQIALQVAVAAVVRDLERALDRGRVFSYVPNHAPASVALTREQVESWQQFQDATATRLQSSGYMLQFDLQRAFDSMSTSKVVGFLQARVEASRARDLLMRFIEQFSRHTSGLAHVNDSLFVVGNAYLSEVDRLVAAHSPDFIRFVDDYRLFGRSRVELERALARIARDVEAFGFAVNVSKLKLGSALEYFDAIAKPQYTPAGDVNEYIASRVFTDVLPADFMIALISRVVDNQEQYLNDGFGRLVLGALRKMRIDGALAETMGAYGQLSDFREHLPSNAPVIDRLCAILSNAGRSSGGAWAAVWAAFVLQDAFAAGSRKTPAFQAVEAVVTGVDRPILVRLWAASVTRSAEPKDERKRSGVVDIDQLHREGYLEAGTLSYGSDVHA